jgi:hypothetical protein
MRLDARVTAAAVLMLALAPTTGDAQCPFPHPAHAKSHRAALTQAFIPCLPYPTSVSHEPNAETESGIPSCTPAETGNEVAGYPSDGWVWGRKSSGSVALKALDADLAITAKLNDIWNPQGPVTATGRLDLVFRVTLVDATLGATTVVDFPFGVALPVVDGKASLKTTIGALVPDLPYLALLTAPCRSFEVLYVGVRDPHGSFFADAGIYMP